MSLGYDFAASRGYERPLTYPIDAELAVAQQATRAVVEYPLPSVEWARPELPAAETTDKKADPEEV